MKIKEGDLFITKLPRDFYGVFKVVKIGIMEEFGEPDLYYQEKFLIAVLDYAEKQKPNISDPRLNNILFSNHGFFEEQPAISIIVSNPKYNNIKNFEYLGNIPLTNLEKKLKLEIGFGDNLNEGFPLLGALNDYFGYEAFAEWRWRNEREEVEKEMEQRKIEDKIRNEDFRKREMKPKKMLDENSFWNIIEKIDWTKKNDDEKMQSIIKFLASKKANEIKQFEENLVYKLFQLDTKEHAKNIGEHSFKNNNEHFSIDYFLYVRCFVIANGKSLFDRVAKNPKEMPKDMDFEPLLYVSSLAYKLKMKKEFDYKTGCDYETFSNIKGWE